MKKIIISFLATSVILVGCSSKNEYKETTTTQEQNTTKQKPTTDKPAAFNFIAKNKDGQEVKLSDFHGKKVYINAWASWCGPCIKEIPELEKVYQKVKNDIVFLSITFPKDTDFGNRPVDEMSNVILDKAAELGVTYPILFDTNNSLLINYAIRAFPTHIFINSDGTLEQTFSGTLDETALEEHLKKLK